MRNLHLLLALLLLSSSTDSWADQSLVPTDYTTIQEAVDSSSSGDSILVAPGRYTGDGFKDLVLNGKSIYIGALNGPGSVTIEITGSFSFVYQQPSATNAIELEGMRFTGYAFPAIRIREGSSVRYYLFDGLTTLNLGAPIAFTGPCAPDNGVVEFQNCSFLNCDSNSSTVYVPDGGAVDFRNCLFVNNDADVGESVITSLNGGQSSAVLTCCLLWQNTPGDFVNGLRPQGGVRDYVSTNPLLSTNASK